MISDPFPLIPSFLCWVGALGCLQLLPWSSCWKSIVGFLLKVIKGLLALAAVSLWVNSSEVGSWRPGSAGSSERPLSSISEGQRAWRCCCLWKPPLGWRGSQFWVWVFIFSSPLQPEAPRELSRPLLCFALWPAGSCGCVCRCHLTTGPWEVELLGL